MSRKRAGSGRADQQENVYVCMTAQLDSSTCTVRTKIQPSTKQRSNAFAGQAHSSLCSADLNDGHVDLNEETVCVVVGPYTEEHSKRVKQLWSKDTYSLIDRASMGSVLAGRTGRTACVDFEALLSAYLHQQPDHIEGDSATAAAVNWLDL